MSFKENLLKISNPYILLNRQFSVIEWLEISTDPDVINHLKSARKLIQAELIQFLTGRNSLLDILKQNMSDSNILNVLAQEITVQQNNKKL